MNKNVRGNKGFYSIREIQKYLKTYLMGQLLNLEGTTIYIDISSAYCSVISIFLDMSYVYTSDGNGLKEIIPDL